MEKWILVLDSGIGGSWTLERLKAVLPRENFLFFMDKLHAPYGNKSAEDVKKIVKTSIRKISKLYALKMIVLACNTASAICFDDLVKTFKSVPVIKIEPQIDIDKFGGEPTLVLVTDNTAKYSPRIAQLVGQEKICVKSFSNLAKLIDDANGQFDTLHEYLKTELKEFVGKGIKNIVLGCTHYNFIRAELIKIFGEVTFFENSEAVAEECEKVLRDLHLLNHGKDGRTLSFCKI